MTPRRGAAADGGRASKPPAESAVNRYDATVISADPGDAFAWLRVGEGRLAARLWPGIRRRQRIAVTVRPEDVVLCTDVPGKVSTRNVLPGVVRSVRTLTDGVLLGLDVGFPLAALVTRRTLTDLSVRRGRELVALVKATAVLPVADVRPAIRVSVVGPHGVIDPRRVDLLAAVRRTGSISAAARQVGITYRAAWLWVEQVNEAWGTPLVAKVQGGVGGGGAALTPEGHGVVERAERTERAALGE